MAFNASLTDISANSFVTVADADAFFNERFGYEKWPTSTKIKRQLLVLASQRINEETFNVSITTDKRALQFPAQSLYDRFNVAIADTVVPDNIQYAVFEQAYSYMREGLFNTDELNDLEMVSSMSESTELGSRNYSIKKININVICTQAKTQLKLLPGIWASGTVIKYIRK